MAEKIKIKSLEKTPEYIDREWAQVLAQRQYLLSTSDWTQLEDNELTFESRIRWNHWRNQVRAVRRSTVSSKDIAEAKLKELEAKLPEREFITSRTARQKKYHLDLNDLGQAKADAILILKILHNDWTLNLIPESINLVNAKAEEMRRFYSMTPKARTLKEYPILHASMKLHDWTVSQTLEQAMNLQRTATEVMVEIERHRYKFTKLIQEAKNIDEVVAIVKNMHGYW